MAQIAIPTITKHPESLAVVTGKPLVLGVRAEGTPPLRYQWFFNDTPIAGETGATFRINSASAANAGNYFVVVSNNQGSATSRTLDVAVFASVEDEIEQEVENETMTDFEAHQLLERVFLLLLEKHLDLSLEIIFERALSITDFFIRNSNEVCKTAKRIRDGKTRLKRSARGLIAGHNPPV